MATNTIFIYVLTTSRNLGNHIARAFGLIQWQTVQFRVQDFTPYRTDIALDVRRLRRIGIVAIGRAFSADICVGGLRSMAP